MALSASVLVTLLLAELVFRLQFGAPLAEREPLMEVRSNPRRGWEMIPSSAHYTYLQRVEVNALGLRGPEPGSRKPGERRLVFLGDSLVYGQGVGEAQTLPARLEAELRASGSAASVINAGLRGYNTRQELALLEELLPQLEPDVVLLGWYFNDLQEMDVPSLAARLERSGPIVFDVRARWEGAAVWNWRLRQLLRSSALLMELHDLYAGASGDALDAGRLEQAWVLQDQYLARFAELSRAHGFRFVVVSIPARHSLNGPQASDAHYATLESLVGRRELEFVDLKPALREFAHASGKLPVLAYDGHYDASANACMAAELARRLHLSATQR